jgi:hypothetical protein
MSLSLRPLPLREANRYVAAHHAHHGPARGCVFCVGCYDGERLCGVAIVGRPVSRNLQDGRTLELTRVCTDRTPHAASKLIAACTRAAFAIGCSRVVSYVLAEEQGTSYRAAGWAPVAASGGGTWDRVQRPRTEELAGLLGLTPKHPEGPKVRWERRAA